MVDGDGQGPARWLIGWSGITSPLRVLLAEPAQRFDASVDARMELRLMRRLVVLPKLTDYQRVVDLSSQHRVPLTVEVRGEAPGPPK